MSTAEVAVNPKKSAALIAARTVVGLAFAAFGVFKLVGLPQLVTEFNVIGFGQGFRYFTGSIEVIGAGLLLWPSRSVVGALLLLAVSIGAFGAQVFLLHGDPIHTIVLAALVGWLAWAQRPRSRANAGSEAP